VQFWQPVVSLAFCASSVPITVNSSDALVVPAITLISQVIGHLSAAPTWLTLCQLVKFLDDLVIICFLGLIAIGAAMQVHRSTGLSLTQTAFVHYVFCQLAPLFHF